jgi:hypothetical protein
VKGGRVGTKCREINGKKSDDVEVMAVDAEMLTSVSMVAVGVSVAAGKVSVSVPVGTGVRVSETVAVITGATSIVSVLDAGTGVVSAVIVRDASSVGD